MRDINFRGKRTDNGEWVYGYVCCYGWTGEEKTYIVPNYASALYSIEVNPETVGQCIDLKDRNGINIFEGDIIYAVSNFDAANMVVVYDPAEFRLVLCEDYKTYKPGLGFKCLCYERWNMQVVGNIYDNPELLGGNDNG